MNSLKNKIKLFARTYAVLLLPIFLLRDFLERRILKKYKVICITFHDVNVKDYPRFEKIVNFLKKRYCFITPANFELYVKGQYVLKNTSILVAFDDGFHSSYLMQEKFLNPLNVKSVFFCCPNFIGLDRIEAKKFVANNIYYGTRKPEDVALSELPMSEEQVRQVINEGHCIGAHSLNHYDLACIALPEKLDLEITSCKKYFAEKFNINVEWFAYPFGRVDAVNSQALAVIKKSYKYSFTGVRGVITPQDNLAVLSRQSVRTEDPFLLQIAIFLGATNFIHEGKRKKLNDMAS